MSTIKITHGERRTDQCLAVRKMGAESDEIVCWLTPASEVELDLPEDGTIYTLSMEPMGGLFEELAGDEMLDMKPSDDIDPVTEAQKANDEIDPENLPEIDASKFADLGGGKLDT